MGIKNGAPYKTGVFRSSSAYFMREERCPRSPALILSGKLLLQTALAVVEITECDPVT